jgi:hypothetical protein
VTARRRDIGGGREVTRADETKDRIAPVYSFKKAIASQLRSTAQGHKAPPSCWGWGLVGIAL